MSSWAPQPEQMSESLPTLVLKEVVKLDHLVISQHAVLFV